MFGDGPGRLAGALGSGCARGIREAGHDLVEGEWEAVLADAVALGSAAANGFAAPHAYEGWARLNGGGAGCLKSGVRGHDGVSTPSAFRSLARKTGEIIT